MSLKTHTNQPTPKDSKEERQKDLTVFCTRQKKLTGNMMTDLNYMKRLL